MKLAVSTRSFARSTEKLKYLQLTEHKLPTSDCEGRSTQSHIHWNIRIIDVLMYQKQHYRLSKVSEITTFAISPFLQPRSQMRNAQTKLEEFAHFRMGDWVGHFFRFFHNLFSIFSFLLTYALDQRVNNHVFKRYLSFLLLSTEK